MAQAPEWTLEEFEVVLQNPHVTAESLSMQLGRRSTDAVAIVRNGIHAFHSGQNTSMLSKMMIRRLQSIPEGVTCAICGARVR